MTKKFLILPLIGALAAATLSSAMAAPLNPQPLPPGVHPHPGHPPGNLGVTFFSRKAGGNKGAVVEERTFRPG
jgi:hypothetical protein